MWLRVVDHNWKVYHSILLMVIIITFYENSSNFLTILKLLSVKGPTDRLWWNNLHFNRNLLIQRKYMRKICSYKAFCQPSSQNYIFYLFTYWRNNISWRLKQIKWPESCKRGKKVYMGNLSFKSFRPEYLGSMVLFRS